MMLARFLAPLALLAHAGAQCPEHARLTAPDAFWGDALGEGVAASGDVAVFGAPDHVHDVQDTAVGAAYAYRFDPGTGSWTGPQELLGSDADSLDYFGRRLACDGDWLAVAAYYGDDPVPLCGAVYLFRFEAALGVWVETQKLVPQNAWTYQSFGLDVDLSGDLLAVRAVGAAYLYRRDAAGVWSLEAELQPPFPDPWQAGSIAVDGDRVAYGAPADRTPPLWHFGATVVYHRDPSSGAWSEEQVLYSPSGFRTRAFGSVVALSGDTLVASAGESLVPEQRGGSANVFRRGADGRWRATQVLGSSGLYSHTRFGSALALEQDRLLVGAEHDDSVASFLRVGTGDFVQTCELRPATTTGLDYFGRGVALGSGWGVVGAPLADGPPASSGVGFVFELH